MIFRTSYHHETLGDMTLASDGEGLIGLWFDGQTRFGGKILTCDAETIEGTGGVVAFERAFEWLDAYFHEKGNPAVEVPLTFTGTNFQKEIWKRLLEIPYGQTTTYKKIGRSIYGDRDVGRSGGSRAIGVNVGRNPISIIVPCHRVVGSDGSLTGYAGGLERKIWLLDHESR